MGFPLWNVCESVLFWTLSCMRCFSYTWKLNLSQRNKFFVCFSIRFLLRLNKVFTQENCAYFNCYVSSKNAFFIIKLHNFGFTSKFMPFKMSLYIIQVSLVLMMTKRKNMCVFTVFRHKQMSRKTEDGRERHTHTDRQRRKVKTKVNGMMKE